MNFPSTPENYKNLENLINHISRGDCSVFVGSGLSTPAGYPSWNDSIEHLKQAVENNLGHDPCDPMLSNWKRAEEYRNLLGDDQYAEQVISLFVPDGKDDYRSVHQVILGIPFNAYITTNFDFCLENAASSLGKQPLAHFYPELNPAYLKDEHIFHIHGILDPNDLPRTVGTLVFTESDYEEAYRPMAALPIFLASVFLYQTIVFIGYSMSDDDLIKVYQNTQLAIDILSQNELEKGIGVRRQNKQYILLHQKGNDRIEVIQELGLIPIKYGGETLRHAEVEQILKYIRRRTANIRYPQPELNRAMFEGE